MAVKIHEFYEQYRRGASAFMTLVQILTAVLGGTFAWIAWHAFNFNEVATIAVGVSVAAITNVLMGQFALSIIGEPLRVLSQAIAHVSNDPVVTPPPNINIPRYERSGLKAMVQAVYELAVASPTANDQQAAVTAPPTNDFFKILSDGLPCGVIAMDATGKIMYANSIAPVEPSPGGHPDITLIFEQNDDLAKWLADCQANKVRDDHLWLRVADKVPGEPNRRIFDVLGHYQKNAQGGIEVLLVAFDRTAAYAPDQDDMDFIALAAHELRGPITVIRGYLDVFVQEVGDKLAADQHELLERLQVSAERLSGYVNNILNVSRYDRNQFAVHLHEDNVLDIFKSLVPDLALRARTQGRKLVFNLPQNLPTVAADRTTLSEVIINLVDNAIKYSRENGEITIAGSLKDNFVEITVTDHGIGMPESVVGNLFNKFYRSHRSRQSVGGTGLGLFICKAIVEGHGGSIWVRSKEGEGSTFGFTLPVYSTVAQRLANGDNNKDIIQRTEGWIKNHAMYRR